MNDRNKTKEELIDELQVLRKENKLLETCCDKDVIELKHNDRESLISEANFRNLANSI